MLSGEGKKHAQEINVSSTKGAVGHLLGGAGSVEAVWSVLAMRDVSTPLSSPSYILTITTRESSPQRSTSSISTNKPNSISITFH